MKFQITNDVNIYMQYVGNLFDQTVNHGSENKRYSVVSIQKESRALSALCAHVPKFSRAQAKFLRAQFFAYSNFRVPNFSRAQISACPIFRVPKFSCAQNFSRIKLCESEWNCTM